MKRICILLFSFAILSITSFSKAHASNSEDWRIGIGICFFKFSSERSPNEISYNKVFNRWERINQDKDKYEVSSYIPLTPLYFNMDFGIDFFVRYQEKVLLKVTYSLSDPIGIGGKGQIAYTDKSNGKKYVENKEFSYTSKQLAMYVGPIIPVNNKESEIYMAFSPMPPVWVKYRESYSKTEDGNAVEDYNKTFKGAFGNCRALFGMQTRASNDMYLGSEATFSFLNYMKLKSEDGIEDNSFQFPNMKWNFTIRKDINY